MTDALTWGLDEVEALAQARLSTMAFDYAQGGAGEERTLADNVSAYRARTLLPRFLVDVSARDLSTELLGRRHRVPFGIAPTAFHRLFHADGESAVARAAAARDMLHVVSTLSTTPLEEVAAAGQPRWFQLYVHKDRELTWELVRRAEAAGYEAIVLTVDSPVWGHRERDRRNAFSLPEPLTLANFARDLDAAMRGGADGLARYVQAQLDASLTWADVDALRSHTRLPILVKGVLSPADARLAVAHGCAGVIVSNHGARQLDRVPATLDALPAIVEAVGDDTLVMLDGGIRRGLDILVALASGARFVFVGRQVIWGLAAGGKAGVTRVLDLLEDELDNAMALCGCPNLADLADILLPQERGPM